MKATLKPKIALITVASKFESGGERGKDITSSAQSVLEGIGLEIITPGFIVWSSEDAQKSVSFLKEQKIDLLLILHCTWVADSIQFQLVKGLGIPVMLWGLPYPETYSFATVQHFNSVLVNNETYSSWVLGLPDEVRVQEKIKQTAISACLARKFRPVNIGLVGPRPTWRAAGPQDMVYDEWDLANELELNVIHIEMDEFKEKISQFDDSAASELIDTIKSAERMGNLKIEEDRVIHSAKVYLATKEMFNDYNLAGMTVECYPYFGGMVNLASSWLADEGYVLDPEGDISHTMLECLL